MKNVWMLVILVALFAAACGADSGIESVGGAAGDTEEADTSSGGGDDADTTGDTDTSAEGSSATTGGSEPSDADSSDGDTNGDDSSDGDSTSESEGTAPSASDGSSVMDIDFDQDFCTVAREMEENDPLEDFDLSDGEAFFRGTEQLWTTSSTSSPASCGPMPRPSETPLPRCV